MEAKQDKPVLFQESGQHLDEFRITGKIGSKQIEIRKTGTEKWHSLLRWIGGMPHYESHYIDYILDKFLLNEMVYRQKALIARDSLDLLFQGELLYEAKIKGAKCQVRISQAAVKEILKTTINYYPGTICTALIGNMTEDGCSFYVDQVTPVFKDTYISHTLVKRGVEGLQEYIQEINKNSQIELYQIGDWHGHHKGETAPDKVDQEAAEAVMAANEDKNYLQIIVGNESQKAAALGVYIYTKKYGRIDLKQVQ